MVAGISIITRVSANLGELFRPFCRTRNGTRDWGNCGIHPMVFCWVIQRNKTLEHHQIRWSHLHFSLRLFYFLYLYSDDGISALQAWLARTIRKLDNHLLGVCQTFSEESYLTVSIYLAINLYAFLGWLYFLLTFLNYILLIINSEL